MDTPKPPSPCAWADLTEAQLAELQTKHGTIARLRHVGDEGEHFVYVRPMRRVEFRAWSAKAGDPMSRTVAYENLVKNVTVHPSVAEVDQHFEKFPALAINFGDLVLRSAGAGEGEKKTL